jgi:hypothetical protein
MSQLSMPLRAALVLIGVALPFSTSRAAKVKVWHLHTPGDYARAQLHQVVQSNEGTLRLSRKLSPLASLEATHVWDLAEDAAGNLYAATGDEGKLFKIAPQGRTSLLYANPQGQVLCVAVGSDGSVYVGTGPAAQVVRIDPQGQTKVYELGNGYVWSLAIDPHTHTLFAGTGPRGRIWKIAPDAKPSVFYTTRQDHVLAVALGGDGTLYAGTDKSGLVYRIDARGKGFVLFQAPQAEVRTLQVTADAIYAGTSSPTSKRRGGTASTNSSSSREVSALPPDSAITPTTVATNGTATPVGTSHPTATREDHDPTRGHTASAPTAPASGENSVFRIGHNGSVREVFREKGLVLSLLRGPEHCFVGTGMEGRLFEVHEASRERSEVARLDHGQVLCLRRRTSGAAVVGAGDPGKLYQLEDQYTTDGTVISDVLDAKLASRWGALRWQADTPPGTRITVAVRSGNVADPDETWSDWSDEKADATTAVITAPPGRYLQYRVHLSTDNLAVTPTLRSISLRYQNTNQAPELLKVEAPDLNAINLDNPKKLHFKWTAQDANEDDLSYSVFVRKEGWKDWVEIEDDLDKPELEWDTTPLPSGIYRLKVVASDRKDNPEGEALTGERISGPFIICHTPPSVSIKVVAADGPRPRFEAIASSPLVRLTAASFAVDGKKWVNVFPADGLFDDTTETFAFRSEPLKPGTHVLVLRVKDAASNTGSADIVFDVKK